MKTRKLLQFVFLLVIGISMVSLNGCKKDEEEDPGPDPNQVAYDAADATNGGRLYDKFWADETNFTSPADASVSLADITDFGDFYRCKGCHAWDLLGNSASYIDRGPTTTRPSVSSFNLFQFVASNEKSTFDIKTIFDAIKKTGGRAVDPALTSDGINGQGDAHPDYGTILSDEQIWDLVKFLKEGTFDVTQLYDIETTGTYPDGSRSFTNVGKDGDATAGTAFYLTNCAGCHGDNGRDGPNGNVIGINEDIGKSMGEFIRAKPYEIQHKAIYGALGSNPQMTGVADATFDDIKNMFKALADPVAYPDL